MAKSFLDQYEAYKKKRQAEEEQAQQKAQKPKYNIPSTGTFAERYEAYKQQRMADERNNVNSPNQNPLQLANRRNDAIARGTKLRQEEAARAAKTEETAKAKQADKQLQLDTVNRLTKQYMPSNGFEETVFKLLNIERPEEKKPEPIPQVDINKKYGPESELPKRGAAIASAGVSDAPFGFGKIVDLSGDGGSMSVRNSAMDEADRERMEQAERDRKDQTARDELDARIAKEQRAQLERKHTDALAKLYSGTLSSEEYAAQEALAGELADRLNGDDKRVDEVNKPQNKPVNGWDYDANKAQDLRRVALEDELANRYQLPSSKPAVSQDAEMPKAKTLSIEELQAKRVAAIADIAQYDKVLEQAPSPQNVDAYRNYIAAKVQKQAAEKAIQQIDQEMQAQNGITTSDGKKWTVEQYASKINNPDYKYHFINDERLQAAKTSNNEIFKYENDYLRYLSEDEKNTYNKVHLREGVEASNKILEDLKPVLLERRVADMTEKNAAFAREKPFAAAASTVMKQPFAGATAAANMGATLFGGDTDPNSQNRDLTREIQTIRGEIGKQLGQSPVLNWNIPLIDKNAGEALNEAMFSITDLGVNLALGGGGALTKALYFSGAASSELQSSLERGLSPDKAVIMSIAAGTIEMLTEKYSIDAILSDPKTAGKYIAKNFFTEATEEGASNVANTIVDFIVNGDQSRMKTAIQELKSQGVNEKEATRQVLTGELKGLGADMLIGGLAGGVVGSAGAVVNNRSNAKTGKLVEGQNNTQAVVDFVRANLDAQSKSAELAAKMGAKPSIGDIGKLTRTAREELTEKIYKAANFEEQTALISQAKQLDELALGVVQQEQAAMESAMEAAQREWIEQQDREVRDNKAYEIVKNELQGAGEIGGALQQEVDGAPEKTGDILLAYELGKLGLPKDKLMSIKGMMNIGDETAGRVYGLGSQAWEAALPGKTKKAEQTRAQMPRAGEGNVSFDESVNKDVWNAAQRKQVEHDSAVAQILGLDVTFYQSSPNEEGHFTEVEGIYRAADGSIRIDINAGRRTQVLDDQGKIDWEQSKGDALMTLTMGHELTHHLIETNPELGREYIGVVLSELLDKNQDIQALIDGKVKRAAANKRTIGIEEAINEVVADGSEGILADETVMQKVARQHPGLFTRIKDWILNYTKKLREAIGGMELLRTESKALGDAGKGLIRYSERITEMYSRMMSADLAARSAEKPAVNVKVREASPAVEAKKEAPKTVKDSASDKAPDWAGNGITAGSADTVFTAENEEISFRYAVLPYDRLVTSMNTDMSINDAYPKELQPRDTERSASEDLVLDISRNLNFKRASSSGEVNSGAPLVGPDMVVEVGNHRAVGIMKAIQSGGKAAQRYTQALKDGAAEFGIDPADITDKSVLVRVRESGVDSRRRLAMDGNAPVTNAYSDTESAATDAAKIKPGLLDMAEMGSGDIDTAANAKFVARFVSEVVPKTERGRMVDSDGKLSRTGEARIRNALFQLAYGDGYLTEQLAEATDTESRNMIKAMTAIAPRLASMNADMKRGLLHDLDVGGEIAESYRTVLRQKLAGVSVEAYLAQTTMLEDVPAAQRLLLEMFVENKRSAVKMTEALDSILDALEAQGDPRQQGLLGDAGKPIVEGVISEGLRNFRQGLEEKRVASERYSERDSAYLEAVKAGDMDTAQKMVDEAAEKWAQGATLLKGYHGTNVTAEEFGDYIDDVLYITDDRRTAQTYGDNINTFYVRSGEPFILDAEGRNWNNLLNSKDIRRFMNEFVGMDPEYAEDLGIADEVNTTRFIQSIVGSKIPADVVIIKNVIDNADTSYNGASTIAMVFSNAKVKRADPVTYDNSGNPIPLSERFNPQSNDIRYSERLQDFGYEQLNKQNINNIKLRGDIVVNTRSELEYHIEQAMLPENARVKMNIYLGAINVETKKALEAFAKKKIFARDLEYAFAVSYDNIRHIDKHFKDTDEKVKAIERVYSMLKGFDFVEVLTDDKARDKTRLHIKKTFRDADYLSVSIIGNQRRAVDLVTVYVTKMDIKKDGQSIPRAAIIVPDSSPRGSSASNVNIPLTSGDSQELFSERDGDQTIQERIKSIEDRIEKLTNGLDLKGMSLSARLQKVGELKASNPELSALYEQLGSLKSDDLYPKPKPTKLASAEVTDADRRVEAAVEEFGITNYFSAAGYILPDGRMLNFGDPGDRRHERSEDHRAISIVFKEKLPTQTDYLIRFMEEGNIRVVDEIPGIDMSANTPPTKEQLKTIERHVGESYRRGNYMIDFSDAKGMVVGTYDYESSPSAEAVLSDIEYFYRNGEVRSVSDVQRFRYSERGRDLLSKREILAGAFDQVATSDGEKRQLNEYKKLIRSLNRFEREAAELRTLNTEERRKKSDADKGLIASRAATISEIEERIDAADRRLLRMQNAAPLRNILKRESDRIYTRAQEQKKEKLDQWRQAREDNAEHTSLINSISKTVTAMQKWINEPNTKTGNYVPDMLVMPLGKMLEGIDIQSKRALNGGDRTSADKAFLSGMDAMYSTLEGYSKDLSKEDGSVSFYLDLPSNMLEAMNGLIASMKELVETGGPQGYIINQMSNEQLSVLEETLTTLRTAIRTINATHVNSVFEHVNEAAEDNISEVEGLRKKGRNSQVMKFFNWLNATPVYAFERMGKAARSFFEAMQDGADKLAYHVKNEVDFAKSAFSGKEVRGWNDEVKTFNVKGKQLQIPVSTMMSIYLLSKRNQAMGHIMGAGIRIANFKQGAQTIQQKGVVVNDTALLEQIEAALTDRQKDVANALQRRMSTVGARLGNEVSMKRFGTRMFTELNYFPIEVDNTELSNPKDDDSGRKSTMFSLLNMSETKQLTKKANNRLVARDVFTVYADHMSDMARYNAMALPILDMIKWYNYRNVQKDETGRVTDIRSTKGAFLDSFGDGANTYIRRMLENANGADKQSSADRIGNKFLGKYNRAVIAANLRVALLQPTAYMKAAMVINPLSMGSGLIKSVAHLKANIAEMEANSGIAQWKQMGFYDLNVSNTVQELIKRDEGVIDKLSEKAMWLPGFMDRITWASLWQATKDDVSRKMPELKGEAFMEQVKKSFRDMVYRTQVVDSVLTRSEFMRQSSFAAKSFSSFMSEGTQAYNLAMNAVHKLTDEVNRGTNIAGVWKKHGGTVARTVATYTAVAAVTALVEAISDAYRDDDEITPFIEKVQEAYAGNLFNNLLPINIPIVSDMIEAGKRLAKELGANTYGFSETSALTAGFDYLTDFVKQFKSWQEKHGDGGYQVYGWTYKALQSLSTFTGVPMANLSREIVTAWNAYAKIADPGKVIKTYERKGDAYDALYNAIELQDEERRKKVLKLLEERGDTQKDIDKGYWEARSRATGEKKYETWVAGIRTGENLRKIAEDYMAHGVTAQTLGGEITGNFSDEYVSLVNSGRIAEAAALKGRLLNAYVLLGYKRDDKNKDIDKWVVEEAKKNKK